MPRSHYHHILSHGVVAVLTSTLIACSSSPQADTPFNTPPISPSPSPSAISDSAIDPNDDLFVPGRARTVVDHLLALVPHAEVVRMTITRSSVHITYRNRHSDDMLAHTIAWKKGQIATVDEGTDQVFATSFQPQRFNLDDIVEIFNQAARVSGSDLNQQLQITEYDHGSIMMTVTTSPESSTVFFYADATMMPRLDYRSAISIRQGLDDVLLGSRRISSFAVDESQLWVDIDRGHGTVERRTRQQFVPSYRWSRRQDISCSFDPALIDPSVIASLMKTGWQLTGREVPTSMHISASCSEEDVFLTLDDGINHLDVDLNGRPIDSNSPSGRPSP